MLKAIQSFSAAAILVACGASARAADTYTVDLVHSSVSFMTAHAGISKIHGRFNDFSGTFKLDAADPTKSSYFLSIKIDSVDTNNAKRDEHLRAPDYFNAKQFPTMTFQSTKVKKVDGGLDVTGDLTLHGITKQVVVPLRGGKMAEFPKGKMRVGYEASLTIQRSQFDVKEALEALGDDVFITIGVEAVKE